MEFNGHDVGAVTSVFGSDGAALMPEAMAQTLAYNADGSLNYMEVTTRGVTYRRTMTWTAGKLSNISAWVAQ